MVRRPAPLPVVKFVADTVAVQLAPNPRSSMTSMVPRFPDSVVPGAALPSEAVPGTSMDSGPGTTGIVTWQAALVLPGGQVLPAITEATVLVRDLVPASGSSTVML